MAQGNHNRSVKKAERALQAWFCAILSRRKKDEKEEKEGKRSVGGDSLDRFYKADKRRLPMSYNWGSAAQYPAGVSAASCPNYPFCNLAPVS